MQICIQFQASEGFFESKANDAQFWKISPLHWKHNNKGCLLLLDKPQEQNLPFFGLYPHASQQDDPLLCWVLHIQRVRLVLQRPSKGRRSAGCFVSVLSAASANVLTVCSLQLKPNSTLGQIFSFACSHFWDDLLYQKKNTRYLFFLCLTMQHLLQSVTSLQLLGFADPWEMVGLQLNNDSWLKSLWGRCLRRADNEHRALCATDGIPRTCTYNPDERLVLHLRAWDGLILK